MSIEISGWKRRFGRSFVYATVAVVVSTIIVWILSSSKNLGTEGRGSSTVDVASDVFGLPLAPGWLIVTGIFGEWRSIHGGQIVLVWPLSLAIDSILISLIWEFLHRKASRELTPK